MGASIKVSNDMDVKINLVHSVIPSDRIAAVEKHYGARFVCETCLRRADGGWGNFPVAVFWQKTPHPRGSNYFGLFWRGEDLIICNAQSATEPFQGVLDDGVCYYSRYRHDFVRTPNGCVDGGRDYLSRSIDVTPVTLRIDRDRLVVVENTPDAKPCLTKAAERLTEEASVG